MNNKRQIAILGSTGSIGQQTLDILSEYPDMFEPYLLTANCSVHKLIEQAKQYKPKHVIIANDFYYTTLKEALAGLPILVESGAKAIAEAVKETKIDTVVTAMVGYSGLEPTINAVKAGKIIALANKETLVVAGELITKLVKESSALLYPVDSEHSAIFQCLVGESHDSISKLILTASGGPFRTKTIEELKNVTKADALNHPNWKMGSKVTIDSASMMNKGFEIMEAKWLFDIDAKDIEVVVHPQSIVHSMVEFVDGSIKAQLGIPDMHLPIRYALGTPKRLKSCCKKLSVTDYASLTFEAPDMNKFPMLSMAYEAIENGGNAPCILNAANEVAVAAFLNEKIKFIEIPTLVEKTMAQIKNICNPTYEDYVITNKEAREYCLSLLNL
ncbi:MAG: 1-deoxy-D-xylulose-5-phosphate reductoisomerase [Muribaculaceae bacterium]